MSQTLFGRRPYQVIFKMRLAKRFLGGPRRSQGAPGGARNSQEEPGGSMRRQEQPGGGIYRVILDEAWGTAGLNISGLGGLDLREFVRKRPSYLDLSAV